MYWSGFSFNVFACFNIRVMLASLIKLGSIVFASVFWKRSLLAKSLQSRSTLRDPIDSSPPGSPVPGILQARTLEWVAISFSNAWKWKVKVKSLSRVQLFVTPWTAAHQAPPSMGFSRQEYWGGVPLPSPEYLLRPVQLQNLSSWQLLPMEIYIEIPDMQKKKGILPTRNHYSYSYT